MDPRTRMMYDERHLFVNGESYRMGGRDAMLLRRLADDRRLPPGAVGRLGANARARLDEWVQSGWLQAETVDARSADHESG